MEKLSGIVQVNQKVGTGNLTVRCLKVISTRLNDQGMRQDPFVSEIIL